MKTRPITPTLLCLILLLGSLSSFADDDKRSFLDGFTSKSIDVRPVTSSLYKDECGSCHFAYQAGWLPWQDWDKILKNLEEHYGDNAELDQQSLLEISAYLKQNSADNRLDKRSLKILSSKNHSKTLPRISTLSFILNEHDEIPTRVYKIKGGVKNLSQCERCHTQADKGIFDEDTVNIPGFDRFND